MTWPSGQYLTDEQEQRLFLNGCHSNRLNTSNCIMLFKEPGAVAEIGAISQDTNFSDICQVVGTFYARYFN